MKADLVILGAGESGTGAALLARSRGISVFVSDSGPIREAYKTELLEAGIPFEENGHTEAIIMAAKEVIKSPGIAMQSPLVKALTLAGIPVIDELEFAFRYCKGKIIGITGSNGKTTTTLLTFHLMKACGFKVALGGNIGTSLAKQLVDEQQDWYVLEISSFQLDCLQKFKNHIAILTNITPDHLDRYDYRFENYIQSKLRISQNMGSGDYLVVNGEDKVVTDNWKQNPPKCQIEKVSLFSGTGNMAWKREDHLAFNGPSSSFEIPVSEIPIQGDHNYLNVMMAVSAVLLAGGKADAIRNAIPGFENAPHRCQTVGTIGGVRYVNDSKATNVDSVKYAFSAFSGPIVWIAGGVDKGNDYSELDEAIAGKVKSLICLGKDNEKLKTHFKNLIPNILETQSIAEALESAHKLAGKGTTVLLSPACASFDLFKNYEDRGNQFIEAVHELENALKTKPTLLQKS